MDKATKVIIYGGNGALGSALIKAIKQLRPTFTTMSIDTTRSGPNKDADLSVVISANNLDSLIDQQKQATEETSKLLNGEKVRAIFCCAGGWAGGNASSDSFLANTDQMLKRNLWPAIICAKLACLHLSSNGLLVFSGAKAALGPTPTMIGYGISKVAIHYLVQSLCEKGSGLPVDSSCLVILPTTLDTPNNRECLPNAEHSKWTTLETVSSLLCRWLIADKNDLPKSGSFIAFNEQEDYIVDKTL